ncbi:MAG TPA: hypothetical protein VF951_02690 [Streptosporangiaceae bacterium]
MFRETDFGIMTAITTPDPDDPDGRPLPGLFSQTAGGRRFYQMPGAGDGAPRLFTAARHGTQWCVAELHPLSPPPSGELQGYSEGPPICFGSASEVELWMRDHFLGYTWVALGPADLEKMGASLDADEKRHLQAGGRITRRFRGDASLTTIFG